MKSTRVSLGFLLGLFAWAWAPALAADLPRSGFMGIQVAPAEGARGVAVRGVVEGSAGQEAGIRAGDLIVRLDERDVSSPNEFVTAARAIKGGARATLHVVRGGAPLALPITVKPRPFEKAAGMDVRYGTVPVDGHRRRSLVTVPDKPGRHPAILFVTGVGCFSQEFARPDESVARLLHGLTRAGYVTMRVEKSGMGDSEGPPCASPAVDLQAEVRGYVAGLRALKAEPFVDRGRVYLVGLSIGGIHAPLIAQAEPVHGIVVINTAAKPFYEYLLETNRRQATLRKVPFDQIDRDMARAARCNFHVLLEKQPPDELLRRMPECREDVRFPAPYTFMQQWASLNLAAEWKKTRAPVLVVIGLSDFVATVEESPYLVRMLNSFQPGRATLAEIDGMDHAMTRAASMEASMAREGNGEFHPRVLDATLEWLRARG